MSRRKTELPSDAKSEGQRLLRELAIKLSYAQIAKRLLCTEGAIRHYARGSRSPDRRIRERMKQAFGWEPNEWTRAPRPDAYVESTPPTTRIVAPSTKPRG